ncbi:hypothetical protein [Nocardioides sp.]|uniref:hypothetical protein n=1 Tax=Nocardioides sp. TaxID=35761 RepID=UPI003514AE03
MATPDHVEDPLAAVLGTTPPESVQALPDDVRQRLADQVRAGRRRQARLTEEAVDRAITGVPLPVRSVIRKALVG